jgi:predicted RNA binding protein YcfA (HicA-like mRNA interferase family)
MPWPTDEPRATTGLLSLPVSASPAWRPRAPQRQCVSLTLASLVCIMRTVKSTDLIRELKAAGWVLDRVRGSHHVFKHTDRPGHVVVPHPKKDLGTGLVAAIRKQAGL